MTAAPAISVRGLCKSFGEVEAVKRVDLEVREREVRMRSVAPLADPQRLGAWLDGRGTEVADLEVHRPSLEDVYLKLTGPITERSNADGPRPAHHPLRPARLRPQPQSTHADPGLPVAAAGDLRGDLHKGQVGVNGVEVDYGTFFAPSVIVFTLTTTTLAMLISSVVSQRELGILKRRRATPLPAWMIVVSQSLSVILMAIAAVALLLDWLRAIVWALVGAGIAAGRFAWMPSRKG